MRNSIDEFTTVKGKIDVPKIMDEFGLGMSAARLAYRMAILPKDKEAVLKGEARVKEAHKQHVAWSEINDRD
jgi:hypothetical protein